jgi:hypothetical protein
MFFRKNTKRVIIRLMNEYGVRLPVWHENYDLTPQILEQLSSNLITDLAIWSVTFDRHFSADSGLWDSDELAKTQYLEGLRLAKALKRELPSSYLVKFVPWEHKKRPKRLR